MRTNSWLIAHEAEVRLTAFLATFAALLLVQRLWPRREVRGGWRRRWINVLMVVADTALLRLVFPLLAVDLALVMESRSTGLLQALPGLPGIAISVLVLDLLIYWQHRLLHKIPVLWRLHRMHHADTSIDVTTGVRFHPLEIGLSMLIKLAAIAVLGLAPIAVLIFELMLSLGALFTHANLYLPAAFEQPLRWLVVTPEMHRVHHSWHRDETDSNFGFHLSIWDRVFRSYRAAPRDGHRNMKIGLTEFRDQQDQSFAALLLNPFRAAKQSDRPPRGS